jgi:hypothetical protein
MRSIAKILFLLYALDFDTSSGEPQKLELVPFQIRRFQLVRPSLQDVVWSIGGIEGPSPSAAGHA